MSDLPQTIEIGGGIGEGLRAARKPIVLSHVGTILPHWKLSALSSRTAKPHQQVSGFAPKDANQNTKLAFGSQSFCYSVRSRP